MNRIEATKEIMTLQEAAKYYRVNEKTLRKAVNNKEVPAIKIGNQWRVFKLVATREKTA